MKPPSPSALHILAFVYLTFSHATDGELSDDEIGTIARVLRGWLPDASGEVISRVIADTAAWVGGLATDEERLAQAETYVHVMKEQMSEKQRSAVLVNLIELARADGKITAREERLIADLTRVLGLA